MIVASSGRVSAKFQVTSSFMKNPPITTLPFSPRMLIEPSRSFGRVAVVASSTPSAPEPKRMIATPVSSLSMSTRRVAAMLRTDSTLPMNHDSMSMWCAAWFMNTPPSWAQVPRHDSES